MNLKDKLTAIKGKNIEEDWDYGMVRLILRIDGKGDAQISEVGDDCIRMKDGKIIPFASIRYIHVISIR